MGENSQKLLSTTQTTMRKISRVPFKILDVPNIQDDFYLNLLAWSSKNTLAVALENTIYLWNATTNGVSRLCDIRDNSITSVSWMSKVRKYK